MGNRTRGPHSSKASRLAWVAGITVAAPWLLAPSPAAAQQGWDLVDNSAGRVRVTLEVSQAVLAVDDGVSRTTNFVDNQMGGNTLGVFARSSQFGAGNHWSVGADFELDFFRLKSDDVSQTRTRGGLQTEIGDAALWLRHRRFGTLTAGLTGGATDGIGEFDLSKTEIAGSVNMDDAGGDYALRGVEGELVDIVWSDGFDSLDNFGGPSGLAVRYDSPAFHGFAVSGAAGENGIWDASIHYERDFIHYEIEGGVGVFHETGQSGQEIAADTYLGSLAILHRASGLSIALAAGQQTFNAAVGLNDGSTATMQDRTFVYAKAGYRRALFDFGNTAFYAEAGRFNDGVGLDAGGDAIAALVDSDPDAVCGAPGEPCLVSNADGSVWGVGVVQYFDPQVSVYLGYRQFELDIGLVDVERAALAPVPTRSMETLMLGFSYRF